MPKICQKMSPLAEGKQPDLQAPGLQGELGRATGECCSLSIYPPQWEHHVLVVSS